METSAKTAENVDKAFNSLIEDIAAKTKEEEEADDDVDVVVEKGNAVNLNSASSNEQENKSDCCLMK